MYLRTKEAHVDIPTLSDVGSVPSGFVIFVARELHVPVVPRRRIDQFKLADDPSTINYATRRVPRRGTSAIKPIPTLRTKFRF